MRCLRCRCRPQSIPPLSRSARRCRSRTHCEPSWLRSRFWADAHEVLVALVAIALLNLLPFRPPAPVANNPALKEALMHYRSRRAEGASALEAAAFATKMISD